MKHQAMVGMVVLAACSAPTLAQFENADLSANLSTGADLYDASGGASDPQGEFFSAFYPMLSHSFNSMVQVGDSSANSAASQDTTLTPTSVTSTGNASSDVDYQGETLSKGVAYGNSSLHIVFTITEPTGWSMEGSVGGTHATAQVYPQQYNPAARGQIFYFDNGGFNASGVLPPDTYELVADAYAFSNAFDGFGGISSGASWSWTFTLGEAVPPCAGDADGNGVVNFADITSVLTNFGADYSPGTGAGDADHNGTVNFADITAVLTNFGLPCP